MCWACNWSNSRNYSVAMKNWEKLGKAPISVVKLVENSTWECQSLGAEVNLICIGLNWPLASLILGSMAGPGKNFEIIMTSA
jgi:hypothetical protein